jgi:small subunit ribosomal protein S6
MSTVIKNSYEAVIVYSLAAGEESMTAVKEKIQNLIAANAELGDIDEWGKRRLAYLIDDEAEGFYVLYNFVSAGDFPAELERVCRITDGVLRALVIRKEN